MLFLLLSIAMVTSAYPQTDSNDIKRLTDHTFNHSTSTPKQDDITNDRTDNITQIKDELKCTCGPYYLCDEGDVVFEGRFPIDRLCDGYLDVCCTNLKPELSTTPKTKVVRGCGYRHPQGTEIKNSTDLKKSGDTPWVVALVVGNTTIGAGVLVHPQVVLTAAHVATKYLNNTSIVRAGEWHTQTDKQRLKPQERLIDNIKTHKDFVNTNLRNDIALLHLQTPMELGDNINVICLPDQDEDFDQSRVCIGNGWTKDSSGALTLKKVEADILPSENCIAKLKRTRLGKWFQLHKSFICAEEKKDYTCKGDGGAPLACPVSGSYKLSGLVAWGIGCGDDVPAVYARVSMFREWVDDTMREWGFSAEEWF